MEAEPEYFLENFADSGIDLNVILILVVSAILLILIVLSALFSISETALFSGKGAKINELEKSGIKAYRKILRLLEKPGKLLATILIAENLINIAIVIIIAYLSISVFDIFSKPAFNTIIIIIITSVILIFTGEVVPKLLINRVSYSFFRIMAFPLSISDVIFRPLSSMLVRSSLFMQKRYANGEDFSELSNALESQKPEESSEKNILKGIVKFGNIYVREIMTSRVDVVAVESDINFKSLIAVIVESGYSRIPVYEKNFDNITGILYIKDIIPYLNKDDFDWRKLIRPSYFVPETKKIDDLLKEFQKSKIHLAIVVDEYGGSSGIITLEDILEEIVGEITDETDEDEERYSRIDTENYLFEGKIYLNDLYKILNVEEDIFDEVKGDADTLAGLILEMKGEFPRKNEIIKCGDFDFKIVSVDSRRIKKIQVTIKNKKNKESVK